MILHCTLPYRQDIPNPALGYLKGFLQAQGIPVKAIYWNLILERNALRFNKSFGKVSDGSGLLPLSGITLFSARHLLKGDNTASTPMGLIFSSIFTKREIDEIICSFKETIDQFIRMNNLDKAPLSGFTLKSHQWTMALYILNRLKDMNPDT